MPTFTINGDEFKVPSSVPVGTSLNTFIRDHASLKGTKAMCHEGGCGACIVSVTSSHPVTKKFHTYAINSCLVPVYSCHGWAVTTIEGVGNKKSGYHALQQRLASFNGTQCGYCSPGMVMNMYSLSKDKKPTMEEIENSFGGNICRCTGYRSILDAFKSSAVDATPELKQKCLDIEDLTPENVCSKTTTDEACKKKCSVPCLERILKSCDLKDKDSMLMAPWDGESTWIKVTTIDALFAALDSNKDKRYKLVAGNTAHGVYRETKVPSLLIDVRDVAELMQLSTSPKLTLGANMSLTEAMEQLTEVSKHADYGYAKELAHHIDLIANVPVRNMGTIAGNLSIKHQYREFPSDMFLIFEAAGATLTVMGKDKIKKEISLLEYLDMDMEKKIIYNVILPKRSAEYKFRTYKIMPRSQNAHAYVNAGFLFKMNKDGMVLEKPTIVFGGIDPHFIHANVTENFLTGKNLFDNKTLESTMAMLAKEIEPDLVLPDASKAYRKGLATALFYKFVLSLKPNLPKNLVSGGTLLERPLSSGKQDFETDKTLWPLTKPVAKVEALVQCSGEAEYVNDIIGQPRELFAAFVLTEVAQGTIKKINAAEALEMKGVVAFYEAKDIPGKNNFTPTAAFKGPEEVFCTSEIAHAGQPVGMIVAESHQIANAAVKKVYIEILNPGPGIILLSDAIKSGDTKRINIETTKEATNKEARKDATHTISGSFAIGSQYHFTMETQSCLVVPKEDGLDVYPATQWMDLVQVAISELLNIPEHQINVVVRRIGGGYGGKITRGNGLAAACALAAHKLNRPVRFIMSLESNMEACGKRVDCQIDYEVGVNDSGVIKYMDTSFYQNSGCNFNESVVVQSIGHMVSGYKSDTWTVKAIAVRTDVTSHTYCRAPGSTEGVAAIEMIMEHIARVVKKDPIEVKRANLVMEETPLPQMITEHLQQADFQTRKNLVDQFNKENRWRKKGIAVVPMQYHLFYFGNFYAMVSVYAQDGTVSVCHGGIEMGQGINTKVAQVVAHMFGIPLEFVQVKPSNNLTAPNNVVTGGSIGSESCCYAATMCCKEILKRLEPIKEKLDNPTWKEIVLTAHYSNIDLCSTYMFTTKDKVSNYYIHGVTVAEVEVDLLTGQQQILRVDLLEDAGNSLSPEVDVGQVEGSFVMGIGYWLTEVLVHNPKTGALLTNRTWNYKPPGAKDIPIDFRIQLRKNSPNPKGVLRSKATGEPPLCMSVVVLLAVRYALNSSRADCGNNDDWYPLNGPATTEKIFLTSLTSNSQFKL